jgi:hypothetical protein
MSPSGPSLRLGRQPAAHSAWLKARPTPAGRSDVKRACLQLEDLLAGDHPFACRDGRDQAVEQRHLCGQTYVSFARGRPGRGEQ